MKRRNFLRGLAASAGATTLPIPLPAKPIAATVGASQLAKFHYAWACVHAQMNNSVTRAELAAKFRISATQANSLFDRMLDRGVLHAPGLDGRSHATRPWKPIDRAESFTNPHHQDTSERLRAAFEGMLAAVDTACANPAS